MALKPLRMGVVGVGGRGASVLKMLCDHEAVEVVAVSDVARERADAAGAQAGVPGFTSHVEMMEKASLEAVFIATPHVFHPPIAVDAAQRGLHILTEKPIAVSVSDADRMVAAAEKAGVALGLMFQRRLEPMRKKAYEIMASGELGRIYEIEMVSTNWYRLQSYYDSGAWRATWKGEGGGILANQSPHDLDFLAWLGGMPKRVQASVYTRVHRIETEDTVYATFDYGNGKVGTYKATTSDPLGGASLEVQGEHGRLAIRGGKLLRCRYPISLSQDILNTATKRESPIKDEWEEVEIPGAGERRDPSAAVVTAFVAHVREGSPLAATGRDGINAVELSNAMHLAGFTGGWVDLPLDRAAFDKLLSQLREGERKLA
ncbi:MAG TPA: Gfo/Idh/MocA family oxidoreductase [Limnochordia bacterium]|nr:Gfo/Idh/MocA family oxidoreductase [Limnochordia bacterium]